MNAMRQQRGCQSIAGKTIERSSVESETDRSVAIDPPAGRRPVWLCHSGRVSPGL
jgi:hypothetical protein